MNREFKDIQAYEKLEELLATGTKSQDVQDAEMAQQLAVIEALMANEPPASMPRPVEFRKGIVRRIQKQGRRNWWLRVSAVAAALLLGLIWLAAPKGPEAEPIMISDQALDQMARNDTRDDMLAYLENTEKLLVSIRDFEVTCARDQMNIAPEKEMARSLLLQQKLFASRVVYQPQFFRARQLLDDLERILVDVNSLDPCTDPMDVDLINEHVNETRILSKLRLIAQEFRVS